MTPRPARVTNVGQKEIFSERKIKLEGSRGGDVVKAWSKKTQPTNQQNKQNPWSGKYLSLRLAGRGVPQYGKVSILFLTSSSLHLMLGGGVVEMGCTPLVHNCPDALWFSQVRADRYWESLETSRWKHE